MLLDVCQLSRNVIEYRPLLTPLVRFVIRSFFHSRTGLYIVSQIVGCPVILS